MKTDIFKNPKLNFIELRYVKEIPECTKMHLHEEITITALKEGSLNLIFNDVSLKLLPNEVGIINNNIPHCASTNTISKCGYVLYINQKYLKYLNLNFNAPYKVIKQKDIYKSFIKLCDCLLNKEISLIEKEEHFYSFCLFLFSSEIKEDYTSVKPTLAFEIKHYLDENYLEEFTLEDLAIEFKLSVVHLIRVFKKEIGLPIHSYVLNKKVHKAKELIAENISIVEAALSSGFFDQSHLNRSFKRIFQITPKEYQSSIFSKC